MYAKVFRFHTFHVQTMKGMIYYDIFSFKGCCDHIFCPNSQVVLFSNYKTWTPPIDAFDVLKIVKNELELTKLWSPKVEGVKNS
jgi:hypothetical protein